MKYKGIRKINEGHFITRFDVDYETEDGQSKVYEMISRKKDITSLEELRGDKPDAVVLILTNMSGDRILVNREFRMASGSWVMNFPAGLIDEGEDAETAAARELREETGCVADRIWILPAAFSCIGLTDESACAAIAMVKEVLEPDQEENEEISSAWYTYEEALEIVMDPKTRIGARAQLLVLLWLAREGVTVIPQF